MTNQEAFTKVVTHLLSQNKRSLMTIPPGNFYEDRCAYRGDDGAKCAVGCLIPDEVYHPDMEGKSFPNLLLSRFAPRLKSLFIGVSEKLIFDLQSVHDTVVPHAWKRNLEQIAEEWHLEMPET